MSRVLPLLILGVCLSQAWSATWAQDEVGVADLVHCDSVALMVELNDPSGTIDQIERMGVASHPKFAKALELLSDEQFPVLTDEQIEELRLRIDELRSLVDSVENIAVVFHDFSRSCFSFSVFVKADDEELDELTRSLASTATYLRGEAKWEDGSAEGTSNKNDNSIEGVRLGLSGKIDLGLPRISGAMFPLDRFSYHRVGQWLVITDSPVMESQLVSGLPKKGFRSLAKTRKFRGIRNVLDESGDGQIVMFGTPLSLSPWDPQSRYNLWDARVKSLPSFGVNISFPENNAGGNDPAILLNAVVGYTKPASGIAKEYDEFYRAVTIPELAAKPTELLAFRRDERGVLTYLSELRNKDAAKAGVIFPQVVGFFDNSFLEESIDRRRSFLEYRFTDATHDSECPGYVAVEEVEDYSSALAHLKGIFERADENEIGRYRWKSEDDVTSLLRDTDLRANDSAVEAKFGKSCRLDFFSINFDALALSGDWLVSGDMPVVEKQFDRLRGVGNEDDDTTDYGRTMGIYRPINRSLKRSVGSVLRSLFDERQLATIARPIGRRAFSGKRVQEILL